MVLIDREDIFLHARRNLYVEVLGRQATALLAAVVKTATTTTSIQKSFAAAWYAVASMNADIGDITKASANNDQISCDGL